MNLSDLVYLAVKNAIYYGDSSFTKTAFLRGDFDGDDDYELNINNVFSPINEAIARLSDLEKLPYIVEVAVVDEGVITLTDCTKDVKEVVAVAQVDDLGDYITRPFRMLGVNKIRVLPPLHPTKPIYIEYKEDIPTFDSSYYNYTFDDDGNIESYEDVDLKDYGINNTMCQYIIEYASGKLGENGSAPEIAIVQLNRAEQYFDGMKPAQNAFSQRSVRPRYKVGI